MFVLQCQCSRLGSIELTLSVASEMDEDHVLLMMVNYGGYTPVSYATGCG
jgi:hypothetical protein